ncbi:MAG TPA: OsmC family protein [Candidatus Dormibacteraeota bacterium]|nr:OsmC family protein [Candidatus Dormibacteraeota bacterium]
MSKATVRWKGAKVGFEIHSESGHTADIDEGAPYGDDGAMRPTEMLLGALAGCTGVNVVLLLKKYKQPLRALEVEVDGEREEEWPKAFTRIRITFHTVWDGKTDKDLVDKAIELACNRYCPIHATLSRGVKIEHHRRDA